MPEDTERPEASGRGPWPFVAVGAVIAIAVIVPVLVAILRPSTTPETENTLPPVETAPPAAVTRPAATEPAAPPASGKELFIDNCAVCHTLSAAGAKGFGGPNLDKLKPDRQRVLAAIRRGGSGYGIMPPDLVVGAEAKRVARFVSQATHR
jgi:mono/diheme cytochrome c family protein